MRTYTLHLPRTALPGDARDLDRAQLVPDGFSWGAFAFSALWFFWHRLWLAGLLVLAFVVGTAGLGRFLGLSTLAGFLIALLTAVLVGLEASSLRRWTYERRGRPARDAVVAASAAQAEAKAMARWLEPAAARPAAGPFPGSLRRASEPVIGLFPFGEGGR